MLGFQLEFMYNLARSLSTGNKESANPWNTNTLEWTVPSPPPHGNLAEMPTVYRGPNEYSEPDRESDFWPQDAKT
jgi:cytochrome c oxidase subunit 1